MSTTWPLERAIVFVERRQVPAEALAQIGGCVEPSILEQQVLDQPVQLALRKTLSVCQAPQANSAIGKADYDGTRRALR